jgi:predicted RNase H-like nuclease (RuvC/YqgF family)
MKQVSDIVEVNIWQRSNVAKMEHLSEQNSELKKVVEKQRAIILKLKTEKKMHKAEIQYRDRKDCAFVVLFIFCIVYALVAMCVAFCES